ncbi:MAG: hypothetical protein ACOVQ5_05590 [Flavobacteriales bacterium]
MLKWTKYLMLMFALTFVFTSCTKDEELTETAVFNGSTKAAGDDEIQEFSDSEFAPNTLPANPLGDPITDDEDDENDDDGKGGITDDEDDENDDDKVKK